jgi:hypothetical protein
MLQLIVEYDDGRLFLIDAEGKDAATIATIAAAQIDRHREGLWTLKDPRGRTLGGVAPIDRHLKHGDRVTIVLAERAARNTPIGSTHPDDVNPKPPTPEPQEQLEQATAAGNRDTPRKRRRE